MNKLFAYLGLAAGVLAAPLTWAADKPTALKVCMIDVEVPPWVVNEGEGLAHVFIRDVMKRVGVVVSFERMPARRCYVEIQKGESDIALGSYMPERGAFPMAGDQPDAKRRITTLSYSLYRAKGSAVAFDGKTISGLSMPVAVPQGGSIAELFKQMNVPIDDSARLPEQLLRKLVLGRVGAAATLTESGDMRINAPDFAGKIERVDPPLVARPYYLILSKRLVAANPAFAEQVWDTVAVVRESPVFRKQLNDAH